MRTRKLFLTSGVLLIVGLVSLWSKWDGSAGINAGYPISQWVVTFNGSVHGWPAMIGVVSIVVALFVFVAAVVRSVLE